MDCADQRLGRGGPDDAGVVVAAVNFTRQNRLRLVVKGGGHSYQATSNAADSLLIWTRRVNAIASNDAFVGAGRAGAWADRKKIMKSRNCQLSATGRHSSS